MKLFGDAVTRVPVATGATALGREDAPPPAKVIDFDHLARMTLGDAALEGEILSLFDHQAAMLLARMANGAPAMIGAFAHTLTGSARGVGAFNVALAAEAVERAAGSPDHADLANALRRLSVAVAEVQTAIADLKRAC